MTHAEGFMALPTRLAARARVEPASPSARIFAGVRALVEARRRSAQLHAAAPLEILETSTDGVFAFVRRHPVGPLVAVHNLTDRPVTVAPAIPAVAGGPLIRDALIEGPALAIDGPVVLPPYAARWWVAAPVTGR